MVEELLLLPFEGIKGYQNKEFQWLERESELCAKIKKLEEGVVWPLLKKIWDYVWRTYV